jgi:hypothetical protein
VEDPQSLVSVGFLLDPLLVPLAHDPTHSFLEVHGLVEVAGLPQHVEGQGYLSPLRLSEEEDLVGPLD